MRITENKDAKGKKMVNEAALELVTKNMQETKTNNKKVFARFMLDMPLDDFEQRLMETWACADADNQERLAIAFPQCAVAMLEYNTLPEKKREKYLKKLLNE